MTQVAAGDVQRIDISEVTPIKVMGDLRWRGRAKFPGAPRPRSIVIFQLGDDVVAISSFCPHEQADLSEGRFVEPYVIECPLHQNRYDLRTGAIKTFSVEMDGERMYLLWRRDVNEPVVPRLTQLRVGERSKDEQKETLQRELEALREAAQVRETHVVSTLQQMEGMIREVEEKKRAIESSHAELAKVSEFIKRVTDSMSEVLLVIDPQGRVREVNGRFCSLLGFTSAEARGLEIARIVVPEQSERGSLRALDHSVLTGQKEAELEACLMHKDGRRIDHLIRVAPLYGPSGKREGAVLVCTDIQAVKQAQRELKSAYTKVQGLLDNMQQAVFVTVASGEIIQPVSRFTSALFGCDVVGKNVFDVLFRDLPRSEPVYSGLMTGFLTTFGSEEFQWSLMIDQFPRRVLRRQNPEDPESLQTVLRVEYCPLFNEQNEMDKLMFIVEDVTKIEQLEQERQLSQQRTQLLEELAHNRSEDLREFMTSAHAQLCEVRHKLEQRDSEARAAFFRQLHTLKGNARVLGLSLIARAAHEAESAAEPLRSQDGDHAIAREQVRDALLRLQRQLAEYAAVAERILHIPNEVESRSGAELHRATAALDAGVLRMMAAMKSDRELHVAAAEVQAQALACREAAEMLASEEVRHAAKSFQQVIALFTHPSPVIESSVVAELHNCHEKLLEAALVRRTTGHTGGAYSLSTSGWTALYLDLYALTKAVCEPSAEADGLLTIERAAERAISSAGTLRAEFIPALLTQLANSARVAETSQLAPLLREAWRHILLHANLESLALLRPEERQLLLDTLSDADGGDERLVALLEQGRIRTGAVVGFFGALRRAGTSSQEVSALLSQLFEETGSTTHMAKMFVSARAHDPDVVGRLLHSVDAHTQAIAFDLWGAELGLPFQMFSSSPKLGLSYLKRLDVLRLAHAVRELIAGNFQLLFERVQTVEVMANHFTQLQKRLREYRHDKTERSLDELEQTIRRLLDVPVIPSLYKYSVMVHETATRLGKRAALQIHGDTATALPREHLYPLHDALVHLLRNGLDHGLETPEERSAAGKPERGTIEIECTRAGERVSLVVRDDGRGIDPQKLKRKALDLGLLTEQAAAKLSDAQLIELVFLPHFSTARAVTDISGRGIGMDAVRESLARIGAQLRIDSRVGLGTSFTIELPPKLTSHVPAQLSARPAAATEV